MRTATTIPSHAWRHPAGAVAGLALVALVAAAALAGCGQQRRFGDDDGIPVAFTVTLERGFVADMRNRQGRIGVGAGAGFSSGGGSTIGTGVGVSFSPTEVYLLGGEQSGGAQVFRKALSWGDNAFTVPLRAGRALTLTVQAQGGREGWESIGQVIVPSSTSAAVRIALLGSGPTIAAQPTGAPATAHIGDAPAAASAPPAPTSNTAPTAPATAPVGAAAPAQPVDAAPATTAVPADAAPPMDAR